MHAKLVRRILRFRIGARRLGAASAGCHPARWLWGLIPIAMLSWIAVHTRADQIERDLELRSRAVLGAAGFSWASVAFSGRDGLLVGTPSKPGEALQAKLLIDRLWGVRSVQERTAPIKIAAIRKPRSRPAAKKSQVASHEAAPAASHVAPHAASPVTPSATPQVAPPIKPADTPSAAPAEEAHQTVHVTSPETPPPHVLPHVPSMDAAHGPMSGMTPTESATTVPPPPIKKSDVTEKPQAVAPSAPPKTPETPATETAMAHPKPHA